MYSCKIKQVHTAATTADAREKLLARPGQTGFLAGGTSYIFSQKKEIDTLVDLRPLPLHYIRQKQGELQVGAMTRLSDICFSGQAQAYANGILATAAHRTGTTLNRNLCTLGGLLVHPYVWPELAGAALALNASLTVYRGSDQTVNASDFYAQSPSKTLAAGDILSSVSFPEVPANRRFAFEKYASTHNEFAWLTLTVGATIEAGLVSKAVIVAGSASPLPQRLSAAEEFLEGKPLTQDVILETVSRAAKTMQVGRDIRCSVQYKRNLCAGMLRGLLEERFSTLSSGK